ncbi:site-2 protease family protein [Phormidium pseudopriestleyi FRX01]|uniref:Site-2 protease family protein n=1 Tax=Phormidium pseudopriestleyi FRX01 TaxID=1759528 RepID=A0ABS3FWT3_9CYAN|nr:site-2 protease family protein [Phormidium pseudopriestleyi]MBO0351218.1 site-2 protease family protein [Phormidium pseudopriestleyi FRX01]
MILWLLLLGFITYIILRQRVAHLTRTPVWVLWLALMAPAFLWMAWFFIHGEDTPLPTEVALGLFLVSPLVYWILFFWGRRNMRPPLEQEVGVTPTPESPRITGVSRQVPPASLQELRAMNDGEEQQLRECFDWTVYALHQVDYRPQAVICRGQLRSPPESAYQKIRAKIEDKFGDRFLIIFQEDFQGKPFFILVPNPEQTASTDDLNKPLIALSLAGITLFTTTLFGTELAGFSLEKLQSNPSLLLQGLPYAVALMLILGIHESGHYLAAVFYKIKTTLPYFIPIPLLLGTFGAFIKIQSPIPNRKVLFDVSIAGPLAGFVVTLPLLWWGLVNSTIVPIPENAGMFQITALDPKSSLILTLLSKLALGSQLTLTSAINLHPVAVAGYIGLIATALNLIPVGQLDGGHIIHAMFGQVKATRIGQITRIAFLGLAWVQKGWIIWALLLFLMPIVDSPALNDVSELDTRRDILGFVAIALFLAIVLPAPRLITQWLNII